MIRICFAAALALATLIAAPAASQPLERARKDDRGSIFSIGRGIAVALSHARQRASQRLAAAMSLPAPVRLAHPAGCPRRAFCGCGVAVRVFGRPVRELWLAVNWLKFPKAPAAVGMVAVRRHHVFYLEQHLEGSTWLAYDPNSGRHATQRHARSIDGFVIVNPRAG
jgi:hypothetical protein